jgi:ribonucleoside-diphosphate reductase alpha chain
METDRTPPYPLSDVGAKPSNGEGLQRVDTLGGRTPLTYESYFCPVDKSPYDLVEWKKFHPVLRDADDKIIFEQKDVEAPASWSERAVRVVAQKYFRGRQGSKERETSVRDLVCRVVGRIGEWVDQQGYFKSVEDTKRFLNDLAYLIITQHGTFNSPVWFNLGVYGIAQQASACFIQSVDDNLESIAELQRGETMVFKRGSGSGTNFSSLRSRKERLSGGGVPSGPVSFMGGLDAWGGVIKSGGTTRRAAKMCILDVGHPDIFEFINCKLVEEEKARALIAAGYDPHFDVENGAYDSIKFQNANHSVRLPDAFMRKLEYALAHPTEEVTWDLIAVTTGEVIERVPVKALWDNICQAAWQCGDPGLQFDSIHNFWHTCPSDGPLTATNPCGEYSFLDDTSCNLASLNLLKFRGMDGKFDTERFRKAVHTFIIAQEALVEKAHYPTDRLTEQTKKYHTLGIGYANLGAYLMACGIPYDSNEGRRHAASITSEMTGAAYRTSAMLAMAVGPFEAFERNRPAMMQVVKRHRDTAEEQNFNTTVWDEALALGDRAGFRNAQVSVLAPTGTISFMMDCDTTGCEPEASLYKTKHLVGGGVEVMENRIVDMALTSLGYSEDARSQLLKYLARHKTLEGSPLSEEHLPVFDCSIPIEGTRMLSLEAHLLMTAALQPFVSGSISKTMNVSNDATVEQMSEAYFRAWKYGIKSITVYRDGCKMSQPLQTAAQPQTEVGPVRRKLSDHQMNMHRVRLKFGNVKGYVLVTPYEDTGMPGELFIKLAKEGSTISGLVDGWAQAISYCLQYGVPLETLVEKFSNTKFEPSGFSKDADIRHATSIYDAVMRKLAAIFLNGKNGNGKTAEEIAEISANGSGVALDAPICDDCGTLMTRTGANCHSCPSCGSSSGCG